MKTDYTYYPPPFLGIFEENLDTEFYLKILIYMLPEMRSITVENIVIQMDNAGVHWSINSLKFYIKNKIKVINWHLNSPDLNLYEILWGLKKQIRDQKYTKKISWYQKLIQYGKT